MARILVRIYSISTEPVLAALTSAGHEAIVEQTTETDSLSVAEVVDAVKEHQPHAAILELDTRDALSVKAMQQARDEAPFLEFIFLVDQSPDLRHIIMAMNEGASAVLPFSVQPAALINYLNRSLNRKKRAEEHALEIERCRNLIEREKTCSGEQLTEITSLKRLIRRQDKLINYLLARMETRPRKWKVLLVSDSAYQLERLSRPLTEHHFDVVTAPDGQQGLEAARREHPRVIISDLEMPGMNGLELCRAVKNDDTLGPNHFIISTANEERIKEIMKPEYMVDDCLPKPSSPDDFTTFIARMALGLIL
jgi:DNA-binding response OmpR family regulator